MLSVIIGIFIIIVGKIYEINYFYLKIKLFLFTRILLVIFSCFYFGNFLYFYFAFEFSVIPIFLYIIIWGRSFDKIKASFFLFFYTYFSSLVFFLYLIKYFYFYKRLNFNFLIYCGFFDLGNMRLLVIVIIMIVFLVKIPVFIFHIWLPLAHVERPLVGSIMLARLILKLGRYGLIRIVEISFFYFINVNNYIIMMGV
jgi:NADH-ubiquinone oxidoreductase chain 4